ncbi:hypothetical protein C8Q73DRAFT_3792 [Cubamyces lactineus]|nr:hypothetical protein C8Q73DRAFT_3792 [Cubamyces lactineus]
MASFAFKFASLVALATVLVAPTAADFHIWNCQTNPGDFEFNQAKAIPSNQYSCAGFQNPGNPYTNGATLPIQAGSNTFTVNNLCGVPELTFYASGSNLVFYDVESYAGTCYPGSHSQPFGNNVACSAEFCYDDWVCESYICN